MTNDEKLAKYEATELSPEQVLFLKGIIDSALYFSIEMFCTECGYYPEPEPHKMWDCENCYVDCCDKSYRVVGHRFSSKNDVYEKRNWIGKSIWLTREEAEAKCKKIEENK